MEPGTPLEPRASLPPGARCAHHPERDAQHTCVRCGNYMCTECISANSAGICLSCASRLGASVDFPFTRDNYSFDGLLNFSLSRWKQHWVGLVLSQAAVVVFAYGPSILAMALNRKLSGDPADPSPHFTASGVGLQILMAALQVIAQLILCGYYLDILENKELSFARVFERIRMVPALLLQWLIYYGAIALAGGFGYLMYWGLIAAFTLKVTVIVLCLYALALLFAFVYLSLGLVFTLFELAHNPRSKAISAMTTSWQLAAGQRVQISGVLFVAGLISAVGFAACCVGVLATWPLGVMLEASLFLALKQPTAASSTVVSQEWPV